MQSSIARPGVTTTGRWSILGSAGPSLLEALVPGIRPAQKALVAIAFIGLVVALARVRFYLPDNPVPITLQTFGILLTGGVLGWRWGLASIVGYYLLGMAGVPVFQGGGNGWHYVTATVTAGYLLGFILAVPIVGYISQRGWDRGKVIWPMLAGTLVVYVPALIWLSVFDFGWPKDGQLFSGAMYPFIPGDLVKLIAASLVVGGLWRIADNRRSKQGRDTDTGAR